METKKDPAIIRFVFILLLIILPLFGTGLQLKTLFSSKDPNDSIFYNFGVNPTDFVGLVNVLQTKYQLEHLTVWAYSRNYTHRSFLANLDSIKKDLHMTVSNAHIRLDTPEYQTMLLYHHQNICYVVENNDMIQQSIRDNYHFHEHSAPNRAFYISCPITVEGKLFGYISGYLTENGNGVIRQVNAIELLSKTISNYIEDKI